MCDLFEAEKAISEYLKDFDYYVKVTDDAVTFINKSDGIDLISIERIEK